MSISRSQMEEQVRGFVLGGPATNEEEDMTAPVASAPGTPDPINSEIAMLQQLMESRPSYDESCLLYTSPSPRDVEEPRMPSSA